jgi:hypothetical protein
MTLAELRSRLAEGSRMYSEDNPWAALNAAMAQTVAVFEFLNDSFPDDGDLLRPFDHLHRELVKRAVSHRHGWMLDAKAPKGRPAEITPGEYFFRHAAAAAVDLLIDAGWTRARANAHVRDGLRDLPECEQLRSSMSQTVLNWRDDRRHDYLCRNYKRYARQDGRDEVAGADHLVSYLRDTSPRLLRG